MLQCLAFDVGSGSELWSVYFSPRYSWTEPSPQLLVLYYFRGLNTVLRFCLPWKGDEYFYTTTEEF